MNDPQDIAADAWIDSALGELHGARPGMTPVERARRTGARRLAVAALLLLGLAVPFTVWLQSGPGSSTNTAAAQDPDQNPDAPKQKPCKLLLIGAPNWDFRYARSALARLQGVVVTTSFLGARTEASPPRESSPESAPVPTRAEDLAGYDAVMLFDALTRETTEEARELAMESTRALLRLLRGHARQGGTVLLSAQPAMVAAIGDDDRLALMLPADLAPIEAPSGPEPTILGPMLITPEGETDHPAPGQAAPLAAWTARLKLTPRGDQTEPPSALRLRQEGKGQVIAVSPELWRLRTMAPEAFGHFWASVVEHCRPR